MTELQGNAIFIWHCWRLAACFARSLGQLILGQAIFLTQKISWIASVLSCERNSQWQPERRKLWTRWKRGQANENGWRLLKIVLETPGLWSSEAMLCESIGVELWGCIRLRLCVHGQIDFLVQDQIEGCVVRSVPPQWSCWDASSDRLDPVIKKTVRFPFGIKFEIIPTPTPTLKV